MLTQWPFCSWLPLLSSRMTGFPSSGGKDMLGAAPAPRPGGPRGAALDFPMGRGGAVGNVGICSPVFLSSQMALFPRATGCLGESWLWGHP